MIDVILVSYVELYFCKVEGVLDLDLGFGKVYIKMEWLEKLNFWL